MGAVYQNSAEFFKSAPFSPVIRGMPTIVCERCDQPAERRYATSRFCSSTCSQAAWYEANRESTIDRTRAWKASHPEEVRESSRRTARRYAPAYQARLRQYRKTERGRLTHRAAQARRRERLAGADPGDELSTDYRAVLHNDPCSYCGGPSETVDHIEPIVSGGSGRWDNLAAACGSCNSSKNASPLLRWLVCR